MNGQNNAFKFNRDPKPIDKRNANSVMDLNGQSENNQKTIEDKKIVENKVNLNPINSDKMNSNPLNSKVSSINMANMPIGGSNNVDNEPINSGMIQAKAIRQSNMMNSSIDQEQPTFSKAIIGDMKNPVNAFIKQENATKEEIKPLDVENTGYHNPDDTVKARKNIRKIIMLIVIIGLVIEAIVLIVGTIVKNNKITTITCTNSNPYEYYKAVIKQTRIYSLKKDKIIKMEEKVDYIFADSAQYLDYKKKYTDLPYENVKGRSIMSSINDDTLTYTEKFIYDYDSLLENNKNTATNDEYIEIKTKNKNDTINLVNSNVQGIKTYHDGTFTCK